MVSPTLMLPLGAKKALPKAARSVGLPQVSRKPETAAGLASPMRDRVRALHSGASRQVPVGWASARLTYTPTSAARTTPAITFRSRRIVPPGEQWVRAGVSGGAQATATTGPRPRNLARGSRQDRPGAADRLSRSDDLWRAGR